MTSAETRENIVPPDSVPEGEKNGVPSPDVNPVPEDFFTKAKSFIKKLQVIYLTTLKIILPLIFIFLCYQTVRELAQDRPVIKPFDVPLVLEKQGYSGKVIARRLTNRVDDLKRAAKKSLAHSSEGQMIKMANPEEDIQKQHEKFVVPGVDISLGDLISYIFYMMGIKPRTISGYVVITDRLFLTVSVTGKPSRTFEGNKEDPESVIDEAARYILETQDPLTIGLKYYMEEDISSLKALKERIRENYPSVKEKAIAFILEGFVFTIQKNHAEALKRFRLALELDSENEVALYMIGDTLRWTEKYEYAIVIYRQALKMNPKNFEIYIRWARALFKLEENDKAAEKYNIALKINEEHAAEIYTQWGGDLLYLLGKPEQAIEKYEKALKKDPNKISACIEWGDALRKLGRSDEAIGRYKHAISLDSDNAEPYWKWGEVLTYDLKQPEEAFGKYAKAASLSGDAYIYSLWGQALLEARRASEAIDRYRKALELDPENIWTYIGLGNALTELREYEEAITVYESALELNPDFAMAYAFWGYALTALGKPGEAIERCQVAAEKNENLAFAHAFWAYALMKQGKSEAAIEKCEKAVELDPSVFRVYAVWGDALAALNKPEEALGKYEKAVELEATISSYFYKWGLALSQLGRHDEAIGKYEKALELELITSDYYNDPKTKPAVRQRYRDAVSLYKKALNRAYAWQMHRRM